MTFTRRASDVLDAFGHDEHLARADHDATVSKTNFHFTLEHQKYLVGVLVVVPHKLPFQLDELELVVVHLGHHARRPMLREYRELLREIDDFGSHDVLRVMAMACTAHELAAGRSTIGSHACP